MYTHNRELFYNTKHSTSSAARASPTRTTHNTHTLFRVLISPATSRLVCCACAQSLRVLPSHDVGVLAAGVPPVHLGTLRKLQMKIIRAGILALKTVVFDVGRLDDALSQSAQRSKVFGLLWHVVPETVALRRHRRERPRAREGRGIFDRGVAG